MCYPWVISKHHLSNEHHLNDLLVYCTHIVYNLATLRGINTGLLKIILAMKQYIFEMFTDTTMKKL
jgi:hypothetical protein